MLWVLDVKSPRKYLAHERNFKNYITVPVLPSPCLHDNRQANVEAAPRLGPFSCSRQATANGWSPF